ncbi:MAG: PulJ/GspJ family protein [Myxococcales bacterium]
MKDRPVLGFTLLEVMIAGGLLAVITAFAMMAFVAQVKLTHSQEQAANATDSAREALRLIGNDVRAAAPGINAALISGGASSTCPAGTIPFDPGLGALACLPPAFRSSSPLAPLGIPATFPGSLLNACGPGTIGYQLTVGPGQVEPVDAAGKAYYFCPDDLVILAVDDSDAYFVSGLTPPSTSPVIAQFALTQSAVGDGLDQGSGPLSSNPMVLISGSQGPVLLSDPIPPVPCGGPAPSPACPGWPSSTVGGTVAADWGYVQVKLQTMQYDLFSSLGTGTPVAMPARLVQYAIQPVDADGNPASVTGKAAVSADLVRTVLSPLGAAPWLGPGLPSAGGSVISSTTLVKGVIDMQVEFGFDPAGNGQLQYSNSASYQGSYWTTVMGMNGTAPPASNALPSYNLCYDDVQPAANLFGSTAMPYGSCFPDQNFQYLRSVRVNLTVRSGGITNSRTNSAGLQSAAGTSAPFMLQPAVQDLTNGNLEAQAWGFGWGKPFAGLPTIDGAQWREMSTELSVRNLALTANY